MEDNAIQLYKKQKDCIGIVVKIADKQYPEFFRLLSIEESSSISDTIIDLLWKSRLKAQ